MKPFASVERRKRKHEAKTYPVHTILCLLQGGLVNEKHIWTVFRIYENMVCTEWCIFAPADNDRPATGDKSWGWGGTGSTPRLSINHWEPSFQPGHGPANRYLLFIHIKSIVKLCYLLLDGTLWKRWDIQVFEILRVKYFKKLDWIGFSLILNVPIPIHICIASSDEHDLAVDASH